MSNVTVDSKWPRLVGLAAHELRTPLSVAQGYLRLVRDRTGPMTDQQRGMLQEVEKACGRLKELTDEMSELAHLDERRSSFNRSRLDLRKLLADIITGLPEVPDREIRVDLATGQGDATIEGDPVRLRSAFTSLLYALRRELVTSHELFVREETRRDDGRAASWIAIAAPDRVDALRTATPDTLTTFDEWRGGCGLSLPVARRIIEAHGGRLWSPAQDLKAGAVAMLPLAP
jgi:signal transduction histidine kinase